MSDNSGIPATGVSATGVPANDDVEEIIKFWFEETTMPQKFQKSSEFDKTIKNRFESRVKKAQNGVKKAKYYNIFYFLYKVTLINTY